MNALISAFKSFWKDDCLAMAEGISFCALLAIIPVSMVMVSIAGYFLGGSAEAFSAIVGIATDALPVGREEFVSNFQSILDQRSSFTLFGALFLVFIATILLSSIERSLDVVFKSEKRRNFFHSRLLGIAVLFWVTLLFSLPSMSQILEGLFNRYGFYFPLSWLMTGKVYFALVSFLAYTATVIFVPNQKVYFRYAAVGGLFFAVGIVVARVIFKWYMLLAISRYNVIYGSLAAVIIMVVWIYYLSVVFLLSAEIVSSVQSVMPFHRKGIRSPKDLES